MPKTSLKPASGLGNGKCILYGKIIAEEVLGWGVRLNSHGSRSATTKRWMNAYMKSKGMNAHIFCKCRKAKEWYVDDGMHLHPFEDGMLVASNPHDEDEDPEGNWYDTSDELK